VKENIRKALLFYILCNFTLIQKINAKKQGTPFDVILPEYQEECQIYHRKDDS
jgi:hypothetical protein